MKVEKIEFEGGEGRIRLSLKIEKIEKVKHEGGEVREG